MTPWAGSVSGDAGERRLLERTRALAVVGRAAAQAERGRSRVVVVSGPAGAGRSAVLDAVCDQLGPSWVVRASAPPGDEPGGRPVAVLVDDAHELGPAEAAGVADAVARGRVALLVLALPAGAGASGGLVPLLRTPGTLEVDLPPLSIAAVRTLSAEAGAPRLAAAVHQRSAGRPAFAMDLLGDPGAALPPALVRRARRAVAPLGDEVRGLLEVLSVAPGPVPVAVAECASSAAAVSGAGDAGLVHRSDEGLSLDPPVLAEVLRADLSTADRAERQRTLARCWMLVPEPCAATIAGLLAGAGDRLAARSFFLQAADRAARDGDPHRAVASYLEAQRAGGDLEPGHLERGARAAASIGRPGLAERWAVEAEAGFRAAGDHSGAERVWAHPELAYVRRSAARPARSVGTPGHLAAEAEAAARRGEPDADVLAHVALAAAVEADDADAASTAGVALLLAGRLDDSRGVHDELRDRAVRDGDHLAEAAQLRALSRVSLSAGDPLAALLHARAAVAAAERDAGTIPAAFQQIHLGALLTLTGDLDEAAAIAEPLIGHADPTVAAIAAIPLAGIDLGRGRPSLALERLAPLLPHRDAAGPDAFSGVLLQVAEAHVQQGDHERAHAVLADLDSWVGGRLEPTRPDRLVLAGRIAARQGDRTRLGALAAEAEAMPVRPGPGIVAVIELLRGLALRGDDDEAAARHLADAAVAAIRAPRAGLSVSAWIDAGEAWLAVGRGLEAAAALAEARRLATTRGIGAEDDRIAALAAATGSPVGEVRLTPRERSLLGLLTEGCTNRQMADRLHLAEKTVRNQLSTLFTKLGVERRSQAAVLAVQLGIEAPTD